MAKNISYTSLDPGQLPTYTFDEENDAQRVILVGGEGLSIKAEIPQQEIKVIEVPTQVIVKEIEIKEIEKPVIIKETQIVRIEVPVIVKEIEIKEIEKQVIVKEIEIKEILSGSNAIQMIESKLPKGLMGLMIVQTISILGLLIHNLIK